MTNETNGNGLKEIKNTKHFNQMQAEFMEACGQLKLPLADTVNQMYSKNVLNAVSLWMGLIDEESRIELRSHLIDHFFSTYQVSSIHDRLIILTLIADDIADSIYVLCGLGNLLGLPMDKIYTAVHEANMSKAIPVYGTGEGVENIVGYRVDKRADGKILKPPTWKPADLVSIMIKEYRETRKGKDLEDAITGT